jgi:hypothetical protein
MSVLKALNALKHCPGAYQPRKGKYLVKARQVDGPFHEGVLQDRLDLGPENKMVLDDRIKEWDYTHLITGAKHRFPFSIANDKSKLPIEFIQESAALLFVKMKEHFHVRLRPKDMPLPPKHIPQLYVIEYLPVADQDHGAVFVENGLHPIAQPDNAQPAETQGQIAQQKKFLGIGSAMDQLAIHAGEDPAICLGDLPVEFNKSANTAHERKFLSAFHRNKAAGRTFGSISSCSSRADAFSRTPVKRFS